MEKYKEEVETEHLSLLFERKEQKQSLKGNTKLEILFVSIEFFVTLCTHTH